jgi:DnaJ family protein B protein 12
MCPTGPGFVFNLGGGPGVRVHQFGGGRPRARPQGAGGQREDPQSLASIITSLLPLLLLFVLPALNALFSGGSTPSGPSVRFDTPTSPYTKTHTSSTLGVKYFVNPSEVNDYGTRQWSALDRVAEQRYMHHLNVQCEVEKERKSQAIQEASGWFFQDVDKMEKARKLPLTRCAELNKLTRKVNSGFAW